MKLKAYIITYIRQILCIAYFTGILWLRRNPMPPVFSIVTPFLVLLFLFTISNYAYVQFTIAGSLVIIMVTFGFALGENMSYYKLDYRIQDLFIVYQIAQFGFIIGLALSELLFGLPVILTLFYLAVHFGAHITALPIIICSTILIWGTMSAFGFFVSSFVSRTRNTKQWISLITILMAVIPPVFYSPDSLPIELRYLAYVLPTTHASLVIQYSMGFHTPQEWSIYYALLVQGTYLAIFIILVNKKILGEKDNKD
jgi:ABC-2 type transport system permease protein